MEDVAPFLEEFAQNKKNALTDEFSKRSFEKFKRIAKSHLIFHLLFFLLLSLELILSLLGCSLWSGSLGIALSISALLLTGFTFIILSSTFQSKKKEQFWRLKNAFLKKCTDSSPQMGPIEHHLSLASNSLKLSGILRDQEAHFYPVKQSMLLSKLSRFLHYRDIFLMQEVLLLSAIHHYIKLIHLKPIDVEIHTLLANCYSQLSKLYLEPAIKHEKGQIYFNAKGDFAKKCEAKFKATSQSAIQEFKILDDLAPGDPWIHGKLATCYHLLQMPDLQIKSYEKIQELCPNDHDNLYRLTLLYFKQGHNAKGLKSFQILSQADYPKASDLLDHYDNALKKCFA